MRRQQTGDRHPVAILLLATLLLLLPATLLRALAEDEAISREISVFNTGQSADEIEAISREVSVFNAGQSITEIDVISREVSVYNAGQSTTEIEAISREVSVFNLFQEANQVEAISREMSVLNAEGLTNQAPIITTPPQSQSVYVGNNAAFTVAAVGTAPLGYQWFFNGTNLFPVMATNLPLSNVQLSAAGGYTVVVTNAFGSVTSVVATLTVLTCATVPEGLVSWWRAESNAVDSVGGNNGTLRNGATFAPGRVGTAFSFDGADDLLSAADSPTLRPSAVTVQAWVKSSPGMPAFRYIVNKSFNAGSGSYAIYTDGGLSFYVTTGAGFTVSPSFGGAIWDGQFHHVVGTYDESRVRLFVDGVEVGSGNPAPGAIQYSSSFENGRFYVGGYAEFNLSGAFPGVIDEVALYNRALTANEIAALYAAGSAGMCAPTPGAPVILVNGQFHSANTVTLTNLQPPDAGNYFIVVSNFIGFAVEHVATLVVEESEQWVADSAFDSGAEGWSVVGDAGPPVFGATPSTGGGYLSAHDIGSGAPWYWRAPSDFRGNRSAAYGGHLAFDLKQSFTEQTLNDSDVILTGGGLTLVFDAAANPGTNWTSYQVPLLESAGWRLNSPAGRQATQEELLRALSSVTDLRIRGKFSQQQGASSLDNVALVAPRVPVAGFLASHRAGPNQVVLEWPVQGGFQLEVSTALFRTNWTRLAPLSESNGFNSATIDTSSGSLFFRLLKP